MSQDFKALKRFVGSVNLIGFLKRLDQKEYPYQCITTEDNILKVTLKRKRFLWFKEKIVFDLTKDGEAERLKRYLDEHGDPNVNTSVDYSKINFNIKD